MIVKTLKNEDGVLTLDFVFASMLIFGLSTVIFSFGMTLSVVEVVQYISYSSARNYSLAHLNETQQQERGRAKYNQLVNDPSFAAMLSLGWFAVEPVQIGDFNSDFNPDSALDSDNFLGAVIPFSAPILYKRIPLIGDTADDPDAFKANIQSFLSREPTFEECQAFMNERGTYFQNLTPTTINLTEVVNIMDNGC